VVIRMFSNRASQSILKQFKVYRPQQLLELRLFETSSSSSSVCCSNVKLPLIRTPQTRPFSSEVQEHIRISKLIASHGLNMQMSRKSAEMLIQTGQVTLRGEIVDDPGYKISVAEALNGIKVAGRLLRLPNPTKKEEEGATEMKVQPEETTEGTQQNHQSIVSPFVKTRVWLAHKLSGELVAEHDPQGRPSLIERLERGGVGKRKKGKKGKDFQPVHLKPIGRLDMITEGLVLVTNDGQYKREMELPANQLHRTYR
jgi:16S rRNA uridine-516 pseudouridylate synthase and related pseudouridylate synthases